jgi:nicotinate-nucleotide adenylyltransferase
MRIGICGGTFDPFHRGHLDPLLAVRDAMKWDRILFIPAYIQPFKRDQPAASPYHRFAMAVLATEGRQDLYVSERELERGVISYTVETLEQLRAEHPQATLDWVIGADNVDKLMEWKSIDTIFSLANFVVLARGTTTELQPMLAARRAEPEGRSTHGAVVFAENPPVPVSATEIRRRVAAGETIGDLVDARVSRYIDHYGLYRKGQT